MSVKKLLKFLDMPNICEDWSGEERRELANTVIEGYEADEESRSTWLKVNKTAMEVIKYIEENPDSEEKDFPFRKSCKVIYPLLYPAGVSLAARLTSHIVTNDKCVEFATNGLTNPQTEARVDAVGRYMNWELLIENKSWCMDMHKVLTETSFWGMSFIKIFRDHVEDVNKVNGRYGN